MEELVAILHVTAPSITIQPKLHHAYQTAEAAIKLSLLDRGIACAALGGGGVALILRQAEGPELRAQVALILPTEPSPSLDGSQLSDDDDAVTSFHNFYFLIDGPTHLVYFYTYSQQQVTLLQFREA